MTDAITHPFFHAPVILARQVQMLAQLQCRARARRQALTALQETLCRTVERSGAFDADALGGRATILIADDQSAGRAIARDILARLGFQVLASSAEPGDWPVPPRVELMLLDVPLWNPAQRWRVRQAKKRSGRLIVATPLPAGPALDALCQAGADALVRKPYQPLELARAVTGALRAGLDSKEPRTK